MFRFFSCFMFHFVQGCKVNVQENLNKALKVDEELCRAAESVMIQFIFLTAGDPFHITHGQPH